MLCGFIGNSQNHKIEDPIVLEVLDRYFASKGGNCDKCVTVLQIEHISFLDFNEDTLINHSKIDELSLVIFENSDLFYFLDVPPSLSFFHNSNLVFFYSGLEPILHQNLKHIVSNEVWRFLKSLPNDGIFDIQDFTRFSYKNGSFQIERAELGSVSPIILGNRWKARLYSR